jgi:hypothetical protein
MFEEDDERPVYEILALLDSCAGRPARGGPGHFSQRSGDGGSTFSAKATFAASASMRAFLAR